MTSFREYVLHQPYDANLNKPQLIEAQNKNTGVHMAIKYFPPSVYKFEQAAVMRSLAMYANLRHPNIIHYHETIINAQGIFLIMNWCNFKSLYDLSQECKITEKLMVRYVIDILKGLQFLHQQGVYHQNLKASNVLLTENDSKLTDFGFSAMVSGANIQEHPYWSPPEVLNSKIYSKESDIWSLGCTIIEMMTGKPPFGDLPPDEARTRILTETPPIPSEASSHLGDFLRLCFTKDPSKRPSIDNLMDMFWITTNITAPLKIGETQEAQSTLKILTSAPRRNVNFDMIDNIFDEEESDDDNFDDLPKFTQTSHVNLTATHRRCDSNADLEKYKMKLDDDDTKKKEQVQKKQQEKKPEKIIHPIMLDNHDNNQEERPQVESREPHLKKRKRRISKKKKTDNNGSDGNLKKKERKLEKLRMKSNTPKYATLRPTKNADLISDEDEDEKYISHIKHPQLKLSLQVKPSQNQNVSQNPNSTPNDTKEINFGSDDSDDDFGDLKPTNPGQISLNPSPQKPLLQLPQTNTSSPKPLLTLPTANPNPPKELPKFSDDDEDDDFFGGGTGQLQIKPAQPALLKLPDQNSNTSALLQLPQQPQLKIPDFSDSSSDMDFEPMKTSIAKSSSGKINNFGSNLSLSNFIDQSDDNDDGDVFDDDDDSKPLTFVSVQTVKPADLSDFDQVTEEEAKIFAKKDRLDSLTRDLIKILQGLTTTTGEDELSEAFTKVTEIIHEDPDVRSSLVSQRCVLPTIEILAFSKLTEKLESHLLRIILDMCKGQNDIKENFCLLGGIPPVLELLSSENSFEIRTLSISIIVEICVNSFDNAQLLIACNGVNGLVEVLKYDPIKEFDNVSNAVNIIYDIFKVLKVSQKVDFSRIFMHGEAFQPLQVALFKIVSSDIDKNKTKENEEILDIEKNDSSYMTTTDKICELDYTFAQADSKVRSALSIPAVMNNIVKTIFNDGNVNGKLSTNNMLLLLKCIKMVAADPENRNNLNSSGVMNMTCELLKVQLTPNETKELHLHANLIMLLADMCALSNERIYFVAHSRLLPHMKQYLQNESELKLTALSVIMPLYVAVDYDSSILDTLIEDGLLDLYLNSLSTPYWCVKAIGALQQLFDKGFPKIVDFLCSDLSVQKLREGILKVNNENAPTLIQKITTMVRTSKNLTNQLIKGDFEEVILSKFKETVGTRNQGQVNAALLELILVVFQSGVKNLHFIMTDAILNVVKPFASSGNIKHQILAKQIEKFFNELEEEEEEDQN